MQSKRFILSTGFIATLLCGCHTVVLNPSGDIANQQRDLLVSSTALMLVIIIPVIVMTLVFAWRYRHSNKQARYEPNWDHSIHLELMIWAVPLLIVIALGALTWVGTHMLDPYRPIDRIKAGVPISRKVKSLEVDVVALDWKWLFIYPQYGIATVNSIAAPLDRPIVFKITASSVMNSLFIPALAGQIYAMPGMETQLHAVANKVGDYRGFSGNFSGAGFSGMHFLFKAMLDADFDRWVARVKMGGGALQLAEYQKLTLPSDKQPLLEFATVDPQLYRAILHRRTSIP